MTFVKAFFIFRIMFSYYAFSVLQFMNGKGFKMLVEKDLLCRYECMIFIIVLFHIGELEYQYNIIVSVIHFVQYMFTIIQLAE